MKKIFYSLMAVALCACSQSEVDDVVTPPQPENNGLKFTVVDNGFVGEDGTRVSYGEYGTANAYHATFEEGDEIGVYAIKSADLALVVGEDGTPAENEDRYTPSAYVVDNAKLTLTSGKWTGSIDFKDADLLFAYAPYRDVNLGDGAPAFKKNEDGSYAIHTGNNRFFVHPYLTLDNSGDNFEAADWMGAAAKVTSDTKEVTFNMIHMRGMVELTTDKNVELTDLTLAIGGDGGTQYHFTPYHIATSDKNVYRILTTEYRSTNTVYATIKDLNITKKYKKTLSGNGAGKCFRVNIAYTPAETITVGNGTTLANALAGMSPAPTTLRLAGTLSDEDWATLQGLSLTSLDMYNLSNTSIPDNWMKNAATLKESLTSLVLPNGLTTIGSDALQVKNVTNIDIPATVTEIGTGAFYWSTNTTIRIPEGSQLATVGNGTFYNTKAVYTYDNNFNVLVLPETLTSIGRDGAFGAVNQLKKVVFKGETAPTISNEGINAFNTNVTIYVPNTSYKDKGLFPGKTVFAGPILTVDNYRAVDKDGYSFTDTQEGSLSALCDGPANTHWHSDYHYLHNYDKWGIYIDITLPKAYSNLKLSYTSRYNGTGQIPQRVIIGVATDNGEFTETDVYDINDDATALATAANETKELAISATSSYNKVRFGVIRTPIGTATGDNAEVWTALSELTVYEDTWQE